YEENPPKGEFVLIIAGKSEDENEAEEVDGIALVNALVEEGMSTRDAVKQIAKQYNLNKNQLYKDVTSQ
ncbi:MAG: 16S rRNA (cytidine(1402)-2'-O)-methyltransferase, partial [Firmicutes bacterium]|nr:16S rRNA (cytidine(1402)-2'-O)-methyltransferase [Bacillota bacterium]